MAGKWFHTLSGLIASAGLALAQPPLPMPPTPPTPEPIPAPAQRAPESVTTMPAFSGTPAPAEYGHAYGPSEVYGGHCCDAGCTDGGRGWARAEYLYWQVREQKTPVLAGTVPLPLAVDGDLPPNAILPLFGDSGDRIHYSGQSGVRVSAGTWTDGGQEWGVEGVYLWVSEDALRFRRTTAGDPVVGPTFDDPVANRRVIIVPSAPDRQTASVNIDATNQIWGAELNGRRRGCALFFADRLEWICGFRYLQFDETLDVFSAINPVLPDAVALQTFDNFSVHNRFLGPQAGFTSKWEYCSWFVDFTGKLGLGALHREARINGGSTLQVPPATNVGLPGGILAQPTNSGNFDNVRFSVLSEVTINGGYQLASGVRAFVGYNFLFINNVIRAGGLIDQVDSGQVPGLAFPDPPAGVGRPRTEFGDARFWVHGINAGFEITY